MSCGCYLDGNHLSPTILLGDFLLGHFFPRQRFRVANHQGWKNPKRSLDRPLVYVQKTHWTKEGFMWCHVIFKQMKGGNFHLAYSTIFVLYIIFFVKISILKNFVGYLDNSTTMIDS